MTGTLDSPPLPESDGVPRPRLIAESMSGHISKGPHGTVVAFLDYDTWTVMLYADRDVHPDDWTFAIQIMRTCMGRDRIFRCVHVELPEMDLFKIPLARDSALGTVVLAFSIF